MLGLCIPCKVKTIKGMVPCNCWFPRNPVIFSDDDWCVQSPPKRFLYLGSITVPLPFSEGDLIPRDYKSLICSIWPFDLWSTNWPLQFFFENYATKSVKINAQSKSTCFARGCPWNLVTTWRIILGSKWLVTPIYKLWMAICKGNNPT